ncbi:MAG TPA: flagellar motor protein [Bryobacteraceae bacterium]|jgi:chemotaxis protein MotA|nr:flagellar motor protein [Bryobacteraceae bacterium]
MAEPTKSAHLKSERKAKSVTPDIASVAGLLVALGGILGGLLIEGGKIKDVTQFTAALIVLGGTAGAVMVSTPLPTLVGGLKRLKGVFLNAEVEIDGMIEEVIGFATKARKNGLVSLEQEAFAIEDPFLKKALTLAVDGTDLQEIRKMLELEIGLEEHHAEAEAKVFECAGGYAPTVGIIGAVMGLIQVMKNLANIDEVGHGIAVAFVATVYGVGIANLFFLPAASKIKARIHAEIQRKELILDGVAGIVEGLNPKLIRSKLESYSPSRPASKEKQKVEKPVKGSDAPVSAQA